MKILFQEPLISRNITYGKFSKGAGNNTFPYGMASIAGYITAKGYDVKYIEPNIEGLDFDAYGRYLMENDFKVIAMSSTTLQINKVIKTFEFIKKIKPETVTVLGGVHPTIMPSEAPMIIRYGDK